jgi:hypothetical protein
MLFKMNHSGKKVDQSQLITSIKIGYSLICKAFVKISYVTFNKVMEYELIKSFPSHPFILI